MSHRCGANCRRKQVPSTRRYCPSCGWSQARFTITAGGRTRTFTNHALENKHKITRREMAYVLDNWTIRGISADNKGRLGYSHYAYVPARNKLVKVITSMDGARIITAHADRGATKRWIRGDRTHFISRLQQMEERNADWLRP